MSEILGKIILIGQTETVGSAGTFRKRLVVVETSEQYSQKIPIDFVQDKTAYLDNFKVGNEVKVSTNIRGNEYNGKYYVSLNGWKIENLAAATNNATTTTHPQQVQQDDDDESGLPF